MNTFDENAYGFFVIDRRKCPECKGSGVKTLIGSREYGPEEIPCHVCEGDGWIQMETPLVDALVKFKVISPAHEEHLEALEIK